MLVTEKRWPVGVLLASIVAVNSGPAQAEGTPPSESVKACAVAYENSQEHRRIDALAMARSELARCEQEDCPEFIRSDCSRWAKQVEAAQPTVVFSAKMGDRDLTDVRVSTGDRLLVEQLQGQVVELDPGAYDLRFERPGSALVLVRLVVQAGDKNHRVQVEFAPTGAAASRPIPVPPSLASQAPPETPPGNVPAQVVGPRVLPWTLLAVGVASIGTGAGLAAWGRSNERSLRDDCSPNCTASQVQAVRTKYLLTDISFGVGLASISLSAYFFLIRRGSEHAAHATLPLTVVAGPSGVLAGYGVRF